MPKHAVAYTTHKPRRMRPRPQLPRRMSTREFREKAEALVEQMIGLLDQHDGDENLEDDAAKEPSLGVSCDRNGFIDTEADPGEDDIDLGWTQDIDQARAHRNLSGAQWAGNSESEHD